MCVIGANAETIKSTTFGLGECEWHEAKHRIGPLTGEEATWVEPILNGNETTNVGILARGADEGDGAVLAPVRASAVFEDCHLFDFLPNVLVKPWVKRVAGAVIRNVDADGIVLVAEKGCRALDETHKDARIEVCIAEERRADEVT